MPTASVAEVIAAAKKQGIKALKPGLVYAVRAAVKARGGKPGRPGRKPRASSGSAGNADAQFISLALDVGIDRAAELLTRARRAAREAAL